MCRIAGIIQRQYMPTEADIIRMRDAMERGGPDDAGIYLNDTYHLAFGHRRLSLLDLTPAGHQPMHSTDGRLVLVFNGEIYNYRELKAELQQQGHAFHTGTDTEVILYAYRAWGTDCFSRFEGMFAIALLDQNTDTLVLARDHAGIKPLYYSLSGERLLFASEIRAFKVYDPQWPENADWRKYFLLYGHLPEPVTTLHNVVPLPKGSYLTFHLKTGAVQRKVLYTRYYLYTQYNREAAVAAVRGALTRAVESHLVADAPVGLFLSGGIDSSLLTILAQPVLQERLKTLSIVFEEAAFSEKKYQDIIIRQTGAHHQSFLVTRHDFREALPDIMMAMDQPSTDGINAYFISKKAKEYGLTAVLSGIGADELFGGYPSFQRGKIMDAALHIPGWLLGLTGLLGESRFRKISFLQVKTPLGYYLFNRGFFIPAQVAQLLDCTEKEVMELIAGDAIPLYTRYLEGLEKVSDMETNLYMQNQLLKDTDYMSMWHGIEVRVPFLDKPLMELVYSIAPEIRYNSRQLKWLLIEAFKDCLPEAIWNRPKRGFVFPFGAWMAQMHSNGKDGKAAKMHAQLLRHRIHWSNYWAYLLTRSEGVHLSD
ncbi:MAG: asparagine synthase (glutamine-hydrolyzing) [Sphingobacteriales bacterium]|nr:MAG: asparagine synthase (glutamine-hydrolyzing) [Sphingobacteriales bacterium]